jgi:Fe-S cluster assembly protein SufD
MTSAASTRFLDSVLAAGGQAMTASGWPDRLRAAALERANALSVPSTREEEWRFTDLGALARLTFQPVAAPALVDSAALAPYLLPDACARLVFLDGWWSSAQSLLPVPQRGAHICELRSAPGRSLDRVEAELGQHAKFEAQLFTALNTSFLRDVALILLDADCSLPGPVQVLHVTTKQERAHAIYPRTLVILGNGSRCTLVEDFVAIGSETYFSAPVTEIVLAADAVIDHVRVQREGTAGFHVATCAVSQARASRYTAVSAALGGRIARLDHSVVHREPGCETSLSGLTLIGGHQLSDTHTFVDHAHGNGRLRQQQKCVVSDAAHAVFNGKVLVRPGAIHTDAAQSCRALLLSDRAHIDAKPQLEIFADDVKCAHGAAIGQLDPDQLFYLRSRGLSEPQARSALTYAFAAEVVEQIAVRSLADALAREIAARTQESL